MQNPTQKNYRLALAIFYFIVFPIACSGSIKYMTKDTLFSKMDVPEVIIIDARSEIDWSQSEQKIKGAIHENAAQVQTWKKKYTKTTPIVIYCA